MNPWKCFLSLLLVMTTLAAAAPAADTVYFAPSVVQADGDGAFRFTTFLTAGDNVEGWAAYCWFGRENTEGMMCADSFCIDPQPIAAGTIYSYEVVGQLVDPHLPGRVESDNGFCVGGGGFAETIILAPTVDDEGSSWSTLKARYR